MSVVNRDGDTRGDLGTNDRASRAGWMLRAFPWAVGLASVGAAAALLAWIPAFEPGPERPAPEPAVVVVEDELAAGRTPSNPHSPYAHLQDQVEARDMRTIHEGGPVGLLGLGASPETKAFCDESNWSRVEIVEDVSGERIYVDRAAWQSTPIGTRAQLASWMSKCKGQGEGVEILGGGNGQLLATYHPGEGLVLAD